MAPRYGKNAMTAQESLNLQSGGGGHDLVTGASATPFLFTDSAFYVAPDDSTPNFAPGPTHWFCLISTEGDTVVTTTSPVGDGLTSVTLLQWVPYFGVISGITSYSADTDKILAYPA